MGRKAIVSAAIPLVLAGCSAPNDIDEQTQESSETALASETPGYLIAEVDVTNPDAYPEYMAAASPIIEEFGGRYIIRAGQNEVKEGAAIEGRLVVIEFPSYEQLQSFWNSEEYQAIKHLRTDNATSRIIIAEGLTP